MPDQTRNLNSVTDFAGTLDSNDRIIMTDNKASLKALTTAILGKAIVEGYTGSSLAGASQSVKSAIDALNSNAYLLNGATLVPSGSDLNTYVTAGNYQIKFTSDANTISNMPVKTAGVLKVEISGYASNNYKRQTFYEFNNTNRHIRYTNDNGNTWSTWEQVPTRAEMNAVTSRIQIGSMPVIASGTTETSGQYISNSIDVTFSHPFDSTPSVILQEAGGNASRNYAYRLNNVTATGFSFWLVANVASYQPPAGMWIAIAS